MGENKRKIAIVGCGPGSPEHLTEAARRTIRDADVLVGAERLVDAFASKRQERIFLGADIPQVLKDIADRRETRKVVVLVTGDPGLCSLAKPIVERFGRDACEVLPGISSVQLAFARLGMDWLDARIMDAHGHLPDVTPPQLSGCDKIAILAGHRDSPAWMANLAGALRGSHAVFVCEDLSLETEQIRRIPPGDLRHIGVSTRTIVLLIREELLR